MNKALTHRYSPLILILRGWLESARVQIHNPHGLFSGLLKYAINRAKEYSIHVFVLNRTKQLSQVIEGNVFSESLIMIIMLNRIELLPSNQSNVALFNIINVKLGRLNRTGLYVIKDIHSIGVKYN